VVGASPCACPNKRVATGGYPLFPLQIDGYEVITRPLRAGRKINQLHHEWFAD